MNFDRLARHYGWMEFLAAGNLLQRCRTEWLDECAGVEDILILGEGDGRFLAVLRQVNPTANVVVLDSSRSMLERARRRLDRKRISSSRIQWLQEDARSWVPPKLAFDCLVTHFFLDCFQQEEIERLIPQLASTIRNGGNWLLAEFRVPASGWGRVRAKSVLAVAYPFFRWTVNLSASRLPHIEPVIRDNGLGLVQRKTFNWGLLHSDVWEKRLPRCGFLCPDEAGGRGHRAQLEPSDMKPQCADGSG